MWKIIKKLWRGYFGEVATLERRYSEALLAARNLQRAGDIPQFAAATAHAEKLWELLENARKKQD